MTTTNSSKNFLICICFNGLIDRLNSLINCIYLAKKYKRNLQIYWPTTVESQLNCPFDVLFKDIGIDYKLITDKELFSLKLYTHIGHDVSHKVPEILHTQKIIVKLHELESAVQKSATCAVLSVASIPQVKYTFKKFFKEIVFGDAVYEIVNKYNVKPTSVMCHIRGTDMIQKVTSNKYNQQLSTLNDIHTYINSLDAKKEKNYFFMTDDINIKNYLEFKLPKSTIIANHCADLNDKNIYRNTDNVVEYLACLLLYVKCKKLIYYKASGFVNFCRKHFPESLMQRIGHAVNGHMKRSGIKLRMK